MYFWNKPATLMLVAARATQKRGRELKFVLAQRRHCPRILVSPLYWYLYRSKFIVQLQILFVAH